MQNSNNITEFNYLSYFTSIFKFNPGISSNSKLKIRDSLELLNRSRKSGRAGIQGRRAIACRANEKESAKVFYTGVTLDRLAERRSDSEFIARRLDDPSTRFLPVWRGRNLISSTHDIPDPGFITAEVAADLLVDTETPVLLGTAEGRTYFALDLSRLEDPTALPALAGRGRFENLRDLAGDLSQDDSALLAFARGMLLWHESHGFCPNCGGPTRHRSAGHSRKCDACGKAQYPRIDPAVIMLVRRGDLCLLGHNQKRPARWFSCLAGFVETGESLEEAVAREVLEEAGLVTTEVSYFASQPWPFPSSLMLGFYAECPEGKSVPDMEEIVETRWFTLDDMRDHEKIGIRLPPPDSMARRLIANWIKEMG
jgi:NAD+ diphosphatase